MKCCLIIVIIGSCFLQGTLVAQRTAMASISGGTYTPLYSPDTAKVTIRPFYLDKYPVTNGQYLKFVKENPQWKRSNVKRLFAETGYLRQWQSDTTFGADSVSILQRPVTSISWYAAEKYCECQGKRLPTVTEWEFVAQASATKKDASGDSVFLRKILELYNRIPGKQLQPVGSTFKNYFGVFDMHGLIWEWTYDFNSALSTGESRGDASLDNNLFCGGAAVNAKNLKNYAAYLRFAMRVSLKASFTVWNLGFRCAADATRKQGAK